MAAMEWFTQRARRVLSLAHQEAKRYPIHAARECGKV